MSTREDCPKCGGIQTLNVMEGLLERQRYCTACGLDETAPVTATEPLPWSRPDADPIADLFAYAAAAKTHYYELGRRHESDPPIQPGEGRWQDLVSEHAPQSAIDRQVNALLDELRSLRAYREAADAAWEPGRWWRVLGPDDRLWCEASDEDEVRRSMRPGDRLERRYERRESQWRAEQ